MSDTDSCRRSDKGLETSAAIFRIPLRLLLVRFNVDDSASSLIECALLLPMVILLLLGSVDFGRAFYINLEIAAAAEAGALYGVQNPADTSGMQAAAILDAPDINSLSSSATYGTECSDGTMVTASNLPVPSCSINAITYVQVTASTQYKPYFSYPGMGTTWSLASTARLRTVQ